MKPLRQFLLFLVYSNLFIAACAVLMVKQTGQLLLTDNQNEDFTRFVFFSTLCSYSFHFYFTLHSLLPSSRFDWQKKWRPVHIVLFIAGLGGAAFYFLRLSDYWPWLLPAVVATFLYSAPKIPHPLFRALLKVAIGKTIFLAFIWMYVTTVLPVIVSGAVWKTEHGLFAASRFFFIYCIAILFDYRDRADDKATGIRSLITWLSEKNITRLFVFSLLVFTMLTLLLYQYGFNATPIIFLLVPGVILAAIYNHARRNFSDLLYYVVLDGLIALSAVLMMIPLRS